MNSAISATFRRIQAVGAAFREQAASMTHHGSLLRSIGSVLGGCLLIALGAQMRVPIPGTAVPMTLQVLTVLLAGFILRRECALAAVFLYLACGAAGLPVFAPESAGLGGPTTGYLVGFALAAWGVSYLQGTGRSWIRMIAAGAIGLLLIFVPGVMWLALWLGSLEAGIGGGLLPFLPKAAVELMLAVTIASGGHRLAAQRRERQKGDSNGV